MIFLFDNYDSFTYNLYQQLRGMGYQVRVARNDRVTAAEALASRPAAILLSPGPGRPEHAGAMQELIALAAGQVPLFGVCLGMQGLGMHFGARVVPARHLMHGKTCRISHGGGGVFAGLPATIEVMRYHSLALDDIPAELQVTARSDDGEVMAVRHRDLPVEAVQFHPESFATEHGDTMLRNFLEHARHG